MSPDNGSSVFVFLLFQAWTGFCCVASCTAGTGHTLHHKARLRDLEIYNRKFWTAPGRDLTNEWLINEKLLHCPFSAVSQPNWTELRAHVDTIKHLIACGWAIITEVSWGKTYSTSCESWLHVYHDCVYFCKIKYLSAGKSFYLYRHAEISPSGFQLKNRLYVSMWSISRKVLRLFVFVLSNHAEFLQF